MKEGVYISLGTNLGNKSQNLQQAVSQMASLAVNDILCSKLYETSPWKMDSKNSFANQAAYFQTELDPHELLTALQQIENNMGRPSERMEKQGYADRTIDLDIIYYGDHSINTQDLTIPHPLMHKRTFVLEPLCEIAPNFMHPVLQLSNQSLLKQLIDTNDR